MLTLKAAFNNQGQRDIFLYTLQYLMPEDVRGLYEQEPDSHSLIKSYLRQDELWRRLRERFFPSISVVKKVGQDDYDLFWEIYNEAYVDILQVSTTAPKQNEPEKLYPSRLSRLFSLAKARETKQLISMLRTGTIHLEDFTHLDGTNVPFDYYVKHDEEFTTAAFDVICARRRQLELKPHERDSSGQQLIHWAIRFNAPMQILNQCMELYDEDNSAAITYNIPKQRLEKIKLRVHPNHTTFFITPFYLALLFEREEAIAGFTIAHALRQYTINATTVSKQDRPLLMGNMPLSLSDIYESSHMGNAIRFNHQHVFNRLLSETILPILPVNFKEQIYRGGYGIYYGLNPVAIAVEFKREWALDALLALYRNIGYAPIYLAIESSNLELLAKLLPYVSKRELDMVLHNLRLEGEDVVSRVERTFKPITNPVIKVFLDYYIDFLKNDLVTIFKNLSSQLKITTPTAWYSSLFSQTADQLTELQVDQSAAINTLHRECQAAKDNLTVPFYPSVDCIKPLTTTMPHFEQFLPAFQTYLCRLRKFSNVTLYHGPQQRPGG